MNKNRRNGTIYAEGWKKDVNEAFQIAEIHATKQKVSDFFDDFKVLDMSPVPGFKRFQHVSTASNHPTFKKGVLYALPIRDSNKIAANTHGTVLVYPDSTRELTKERLHALVASAIEDRLPLEHHKLVLGGFLFEAAKPEEITYNGRNAAWCFPDPVESSTMFIVFDEGNNIVGTVQMKDSEVDECANVDLEVLNRVLGESPSFVPGHGDQKYYRICETNHHEGVGYKDDIYSIEYGFKARLYDVSGEPDHWAFYGIPA